MLYLKSEKFDPIWGSFFVGVVCCAMSAAGSMLLYFGEGEWMGVALLAGVALGLIVHVLQVREYRKRVAATEPAK